MIPRSLFVKIFLWFWLANTIVVAALALMVWIEPLRTSRRPPGSLDRLHALQVGGALAVRDSKGMAEFERHARELEQASGLRTWWIDPAGREIRGERVPARVLEDRDPRGPGGPGPGPPRPMVFALTDARGEVYRAIAEPTGPGPSPYFQELISSRAFALRVLAAVLAAGLGCYALARYLTSPLDRLQGATRRLASGDLAVRVGEPLTARRDELGELGRDFDRMAQQVESLITSHKRLLQDVSHELRSPLARLNVALELASGGSEPAQTPALARVAKEAERLNELIGQLLNLARLEGAAAQSSRTRVDLRELVEAVAADADFEARALGKRVQISRCEDCAISGLPGLLRSALENVMRNAVHYTAEGSEVDVSLRVEVAERGARARIEVRDRGPGVPEEALEYIFQPFYRVSEARERAFGGAGLGLAIADRAIRLHGGSVSAANALGGGLSVGIELPA